jgi:hypothetical protein
MYKLCLVLAVVAAAAAQAGTSLPEFSCDVTWVK